MKIIYESREYTRREEYRMTKNADIEKLSLHAGDIVTINGALIFEDEKEDGTVETILSLELASGTVIATNSATVKRSFKAICDIYNGLFPIEDVLIKEGVSKKGDKERVFYDLALV